MINHFRQHMKRPLIGVGHSMGGNNLVNLSIMHPRLFTTLIMIDPVIQRRIFAAGNGIYSPAKASTLRREIWPSREEAAKKLKRSKFYQKWDPRVLDLWLKYGLRDLPTYLFPEATPPASSTPLPAITADPTTATPSTTPSEKPVTLTTTKHQEVSTFMRANFPTPEYPNPSVDSNPLTHSDVDPATAPNSPFYSPVPLATFNSLQHLRPSVFYIFGDPSAGAILSAPVLRADKLAHTGAGVGGSGGVKKGRVSSVTFEGVGHLIPMEVVGKTADAATGWLAPEIERWRAIEDAERRDWAAVPMAERAMLSEEYVSVMTSDHNEESLKGAKL